MALPAAAQETGLKIGGTGTTLDTMRVLGAVFELDNPNVRVAVLSSLGSTGGIKATLSGAIDIGVSARPLTAAERAAELLHDGVIKPSAGLTPAPG